MSLRLQFEFPFGYSATLWNRHVNAGPSEVIPSGWRVARAAVAAWWHIGHESAMSVERFESALTLLSGDPVWVCPDYQENVWQAFQPKSLTSADGNCLHFERSVYFDNPLVGEWTSAKPNAEQLEDLSTLFGSLDYFGRSTSLANISVSSASESESSSLEITAAPLRADDEQLDAGDIHLTLNAESASIDKLTVTTRSAGQRPAGSVWTPYLLKAKKY